MTQVHCTHDVLHRQVGDKVGSGLQIMNNEFGGGSIYHCSSAARTKSGTTKSEWGAGFLISFAPLHVRPMGVRRTCR